jgi:hypothetical protein
MTSPQENEQYKKGFDSGIIEGKANFDDLYNSSVEEKERLEKQIEMKDEERKKSEEAWERMFAQYEKGIAEVREENRKLEKQIEILETDMELVQEGKGAMFDVIKNNVESNKVMKNIGENQSPSHRLTDDKREDVHIKESSNVGENPILDTNNPLQDSCQKGQSGITLKDEYTAPQDDLCENCGQREDQHSITIHYSKDGIVNRCRQFVPKKAEGGK